MIKRLLLLNGLAIVGVVTAHAAQWMWIVMFWWTDRYSAAVPPNYDLLGTAPYYGVVTLQKMGVFAVPAFLFATGFFAAFAHRGSDRAKWSVVGSRLKFLLIPYFIWSVIILMGDYFQGNVYSAGEYARRLALGDAVPAFYYIFILCQLYILAVFLAPIAKKHGKALLIGTGALLLGIIGIFYWKLYFHYMRMDTSIVDVAITLVPSRSFVRWVFFLSLGMVSGFNMQELGRWLNRHRRTLLIIAIVSFPLAVIETEWIFQVTGIDFRGGVFTLPGAVYALSTTLAFLGYAHVEIPLSKLAYDLGRASFGIYLIHTTVLEFSARALQRYAPQMLAYPVFLQLFLVVLAVAIPFMAIKLVNRSPARKWSRYIFG